MLLYIIVLKEDVILKIGNWLRDKRYNLNLTQKELSIALGLTVVTISNIENSKHCGRKSIYAMSRYFKVPIKELLDLRNENN